MNFARTVLLAAAVAMGTSVSAQQVAVDGDTAQDADAVTPITTVQGDRGL